MLEQNTELESESADVKAYIAMCVATAISQVGHLYCVCVKYLLLTECAVRTVSYGPSFFLVLWPKCKVCGP